MGVFKNMTPGQARSYRASQRAAVTVEFTGLENIQEIFNKLPARYAKKPIHAAFRKAAKPFVSALKSSAPRATGDTKKAIGIKAGKGPYISVGIQGKGKMSAYFKAYWNNYGTEANRDNEHVFKFKRKPKSANWKGGIVPLRFVERSWDQTKEQVAKIANDEMMNETNKFLKKYAI